MICILLETEWSELKDHVGLDWLAMQGKPKKSMGEAQQIEGDR